MAQEASLAVRLAAITLFVSHSVALDNGLGLTPPLAWSSWNCFGLDANETGVLSNAQALIDSGLAKLGFQYVNIDAGYLAGRDSSGRLVVNSQRYPSGIRNLSDTLHSMGLKLGVYTDLSGHTCGNGPGTGSKGHYQLDAQTFADWGADYLKVDFCGPGNASVDPRRISVDPKIQYAAWAELRDALNSTGRQIYYSICPHTPGDGVGTETPWKMLYAPPFSWTSQQRHELANSLLVEYSNTADQWIGGSEGGIMENLDSMLHATRLEYSVPGSWNDADMLQVCNYGQGNTPGTGMTLTEYQSHYSIWSILGSPLILGVDVKSMISQHPDCLAMLLNQDIVAINQDPFGAAARLVRQEPPMNPNITSYQITSQVLSRSLSQNRLAVLLLNRAPEPQHLNVSWAELSVTGKQSVYNVTARQAAGTRDDYYEALVPSHGVAFVILAPVQV